MTNSVEPSSSISFTSTSNTLNSGSIGISQDTCACGGSETGITYEITSLSKVSNNLEKLLLDSSSDFSDAEIVVEGVSVGVHCCILAARSKFFRDLFRKEKGIVERKLKQFPLETSTCVDTLCALDSCRPAINFPVRLMYASYMFQVPELVSLFLILDLTEKAVHHSLASC
ncbi:Regulatory protein NPR3 [Capsicum baccatum]|uniref:Regulatory protein NPR3 n=1 Tax=Capsicum baccatum TaxID=33114 RepID=A0A2G2XBK1_CAPBA|nr:Regulatory protein NPR3 [Capsicum baccatum]